MDIPSIFTLKDKKEELLKLYGFGETKVTNILASIEKAKRLTTDKILISLCIDNIGSKVAKDISKMYSIFELIEEIQADSKKVEKVLLEIDGFGDTITNSIISYFLDTKNSSLVFDLVDLGVLIEKPQEEVVASEKLKGKNFVITGTLSVPRKELIQIITENGGKVQSAVSSTTDYLILNDVNSTSSKAVKARDLEKPIITEDQFRDILK